ncbi:MAG: tRNA1(Val) (adenine(37)-N6)-methyltransferase [Lachnospiraceae bacterium]|nr:tRNA1(Val) (adenine(37)-N6)-methyltransferase [Lachnospiraceae bacterium]
MRNDVLINEWERIDDLHRNGYMLIQNPKAFCFGIDAVLLSDFAVVKEGEEVLDIGTGTGVIPILLCGKTKGKHFTGIEIQEESVFMAKRSVLLNSLENRIDICLGDIRKYDEYFKPSSFDVVVTNPPYMSAYGGLKNDALDKSVARHEISLTLSEVIGSAKKLLKPQGRFYMIHRPQRLADIFFEMRSLGIEPKTLRLIHTTPDKEPSMALVSGVRNGRPMLKVMPPIIIYNPDGSYTEEIRHIYYD